MDNQTHIYSGEDGLVYISLKLPDGRSIEFGYHPVTARALAERFKKAAKDAEETKYIRPNHN